MTLDGDSPPRGVAEEYGMARRSFAEMRGASYQPAAGVPPPAPPQPSSDPATPLRGGCPIAPPQFPRELMRSATAGLAGRQISGDLDDELEEGPEGDVGGSHRGSQSLLNELCPGLRLRMACTLTTLALFAVNVVLWCQSQEVFDAVWDRLALRGGAVGNDYQFYRLFSAIGIHYGVKELLVCTLAGLQVSAQIEAKFGAGRWLAMYVVAGVMGGLVAAALDPQGIYATNSAASLSATGFQFGEICVVFPQLLFASRSYRTQLVCAFGVCLIQFVTTALLVAMSSWVVALAGFLVGTHFAVNWNPSIQAHKRRALLVRVVSIASFVGVSVACCVCIFSSSRYVAEESDASRTPAAWARDGVRSLLRSSGFPAEAPVR